jgi:Cu(I)/Ag(I) efflux system membrane fusion protein/cobalt-zinc-cadmium efflux system membrane fusion protein
MKLTPDKEASELTGDSQKQLYTCSMHPQVLQDEPGNCPICAMKLTPVKDPPVVEKPAPTEKGKQLWTCGMHPQVLEEEPGFCPICNMKLTPVKSESNMQHEHGGEEPSADTVRIDPTFVQNIGVQSEPVRRADIPFTIRTVGTLTYDDRQVAWINTKYEGWIEKAYVNYVGEPVEKGQKLFEIYSPQLVTTQKEYLQAIDYRERMKDSGYPEIAARAASLVESARQRLRYWDITDAQIRELETSREAKRTLAVTSPVNGVVVEKMDKALEGMRVTPGMNLYKLVDLSTVWVEVEIFENQVPWVKVGQWARVELPYEPGKAHRGRVRYVYPFFDDKTRTMKASLELPNPRGSLRADMYADVTIEVPSATNVLTVPEESVIHSGKRNIVVLDRGNGRFEVKEVTLGVNGSGVWEVQSGIEEGDRIVVSSQFLIDSESNLQEAIRKMVSRQTSDISHQH